jgi:Ni/Co efflux regulator RcnB
MNNKYLVTSVLMAALMAASVPGFAQDRGHRDNDRNNDRYSQRDNDRHDNRGNNGFHGNGNNGHHDRDDRDNRSWEGRDNKRWDGAGPEHTFRRGDRLPSRYRNNQYVVSNYRDHHLRQPPRGYHWVQTGSDYVLAAIATGVIADLLINR